MNIYPYLLPVSIQVFVYNKYGLPFTFFTSFYILSNKSHCNHVALPPNCSITLYEKKLPWISGSLPGFLHFKSQVNTVGNFILFVKAEVTAAINLF